MARVSLNCTGFTRARYHPETAQFQTGSLSQVNPLGIGQELTIYSRSARSRINARLISANFVPGPNRSDLV